MNRDKKIKSIRPTLNLVDTNTKSIELFQNETLRPILKLQNELTLSLLKNHKNYNPITLYNPDRLQYETRLLKYIQSNLELKNQLIGMIVGMFTNSEIEFYHKNRKELKKRITQMQLKRFVDMEFTKSDNII